MAKKKIEIILKKDYPNIGNKNTIIKVTRGYAFNYLIPNEIAELATKNKMKHLNMFQIIQNKKLQDNEIKAENLGNNLKQIKNISLFKKIGDENYIFGNINEKDIIEKIFRSTGIELNKKQIKVPNIKTIGKFQIEINLLNDKYYQLKLNIIPINI
uniref:50S ribosomal protein L9, chloroplastic n=1 Tax=Cumathamnion serrulatum TaxID=1206573 RepID=A0A7U1AR16_9FLOR|nr:ribosomal protein L9 [Cumathamnion serrulatum]QQY85352.1 ribosomal protein L9 [Cumathamnion serrulatum]